MESFVLNVRTLSGQGNFHELSEYLQKSMEMLVRNPNQLSNALETLDIQQHSLGVMAVLSAKLQQSTISDWDDLFNRVAVFLTECNGEQIRHSPQNFAELCHLFTNKLVERESPLMGLPSLLRAINKIQLTETSLTSVTSDVFKVCLTTKCFHPALKLLQVDITDISNEACADPKYVLLYFYYGALILTAVKDYDRALYFLEACVTIPAVAVSHIMLEAYKKYLLVSLIIGGDRTKDSLTLPKYTSPVINKYIKPLCNSYVDLVNAFYTNNMSEVQSTINQYSDVYAADKNTGLVAQVCDSMTKTNIKRLTKTFLTLSLEDVAARAGLSSPREAERWLVIMIEEGSIHATISQKDGMVRFDTNPERFASVSMLKKLESSIIGAIKLDSQIVGMDEEIVLNPNFIKKSNVGNAAGGGQRKNSDIDLCDDAGLSQSPSSLVGSRPSSSGIDGFFVRQTPPPPTGNSN